MIIYNDDDDDDDDDADMMIIILCDHICRFQVRQGGGEGNFLLLERFSKNKISSY